ncbi:hypothetical protein LI173_22340 [Phocaeicola vulgatus]|uniref:hypothetical protein n=1 Tax=Phocaeicola vulgatus TaxID=821 RepID=UPI001D073038|nr:hypothetical protein [Phocaeicola vulgatus]
MVNEKKEGASCITTHLQRVNNGLPGQTVKGRGCCTEEGGCLGNAEAPDDDHCNPDHVGNLSFLVCP